MSYLSCSDFKGLGAASFGAADISSILTPLLEAGTTSFATYQQGKIAREQRKVAQAELANRAKELEAIQAIRTAEVEGRTTRSTNFWKAMDENLGLIVGGVAFLGVGAVAFMSLKRRGK